MFSGYFYILGAAACWGLIGIFSRVAFSEGVEPMEVAFWRAVITWGCFGAQALRQNQVAMKIRDLPLLIFFSAFGISLFYVSYQYAVKSGGAALASVLLYTAPAWVVIVSFFVYGEKISRIKGISVLMVILGVLLISGSGTNEAGGGTPGMTALLTGLAAGFCYSLYYTVGKYFSSRYSAANLFFYVLPLGALGIFPFVQFTEKSWLAWGALFSVSIISTYIANFCYYTGLKYLEAGRASIVATLEPVIAAVAAYLLFQEYFTLSGYLGAALVVAAVVATICDQRSPKASSNVVKLAEDT